MRESYNKKRRLIQEEIEKCFELVSEFTIIKERGNTGVEKYQFKYNGKLTKEIDSELLFNVKKLTPYLYTLYKLQLFPPITALEDKLYYNELWGMKGFEAEEAGRIKYIAEELTREGKIRLYIKDYIENGAINEAPRPHAHANIALYKKAGEEIDERGVYFRDRIIKGRERGDYFICKYSVFKRILSLKGLSSRVINKISRRELYNILSEYKIIADKINMSTGYNTMLENKQYRVWGIPLKAGTRRLKYGKEGK